VYRTVEKLHNSEGRSQADAAASGTRSKKKLKDFLTMLGSDAFAGVADGNLRHFAAAAEHDAKLAAARHRLGSVENQIKDGLLKQITINEDLWHVYRQELCKLHSGFLQLWPCCIEHFAEQFRELCSFEAHIHRTAEIKESFYDGVKAIDLLV